MRWDWRQRVAAAGDVIFALLAIAWLHSELTGGFRWDLGLFTISNRGSARVFMQAMAVLVLRHLVVPRPNIRSRFPRVPARVEFRRLWIDHARPLWLVIIVVAVTRLAVFGVGWMSTIAMPLTGDPVRDESFVRSKSAPLEYLHGRWDAGWYASIATWGYQQQGNPQTVAFFPAFPIAVRGLLSVVDPILTAIERPKLLGRERGVRAETVGALFSIVVFSVALLLLGRLADLELGAGFGGRAIVIAGVAPYSIFFSAPFTESLFLLAVVGAFLSLRLNRFAWCALFGLLAGLTRQTGFLLTIPLAVQAASLWRTWPNDRRRRLGACAAVMAPVAGMLVYSGYLGWALGDPLAWVWAQGAWGKSERWLRLQHVESLRVFASYYPYEALNLLAVALALPLVWRSRRIQPAYLVFGLISLAVPLVVGVLPLGRMTAPVFPIYLVLASRVRSPQAFGVLTVVLFVLQLAAASQFYGWRHVN